MDENNINNENELLSHDVVNDGAGVGFSARLVVSFQATGVLGTTIIFSGQQTAVIASYTNGLGQTSNVTTLATYTGTAVPYIANGIFTAPTVSVNTTYTLKATYNGIVSNTQTITVEPAVPPAGALTLIQYGTQVPANTTSPNLNYNVLYGSTFSLQALYSNPAIIDVTASCTYSGNGATYFSGNTFTPPAAGTYQIIATYTYSGSLTTSSNTVNFNVTNPSPVNINSPQACPGTNFTVTGNYFDSTSQIYINNILCSIVSGPTNLGSNNWTITATLPSGTWGYGQSYGLTVTSQNGTGSSTFLVPSTCAPAPSPPSAGTLTIYADSTNIIVGKTTNVHANYTDASGTQSVDLLVTWSGTGPNLYSGNFGQSNGTSFKSATTGSFTFVATYQYYSGVYGNLSVTSNSITITVAQPVPVPILTSITSGCPGSVVTITGQYFSSDVAAYIVQTNNVLQAVPGTLTTNNNTTYQFNVTLPNTLSPVAGTSYTLYVTGSNGSSNSITFTIPSGCGLVTAPPSLTITGLSNLCCGVQYQYHAIYATQAIVNNAVVTTTSDVSSFCTWTTTLSSQSTITNGVFNAPAIVGTYQLTATYLASSSSGVPFSISNGFSVVVQNCAVVSPTTSSATEVWVTPTSATVNCGNTYQFTAFYATTTGSATAVTPTYWLVNEIPGGNSQIGTISSSGLYTAPGTLPGFIYVKVSAIYASLEGYSVVALYNPIPQTPACNITVGSQINIFFGDGRQGYLLKGTTISLQPGQYWIAQYAETLGTDFVAFNTGAQQMTSLAYFAQSSTASNSIYNQGQLVSLANGQYTRTYSIILGVCDPITGYFNSPWDIVPFSYPLQDNYPLQPHSIFIDDEKTIAIDDFAKNKLKNYKPLDVTKQIERNNAHWIGLISYNNEKILIEDALKLYYIDSITQNYELKYISGSDSYNIFEGQSLVAIPTSAGGWEIQVLPANANLFDNSHTYVLGTIIDGQLCSEWPITKLVDKKSINNISDLPSSYLSILRKIKKVKNGSSLF